MCSFLLPGTQKGRRPIRDNIGGCRREGDQSLGPHTQQVLTRFLVGRGQANWMVRKERVEGKQRVERVNKHQGDQKDSGAQAETGGWR